jgi:endonuclease/exonuclease/phosphatase family metal-dependent hydrolase
VGNEFPRCKPWPGARLTVVSYNIRSCRGIDRRTDPERIAAVIGAMNADIIALQEVGSQLGIANDVRQLAELAAGTGLRAIPGPTLLRPDAPCGTALLTRYPVLAVRHTDLSMPGREPRGALDADLAVANRHVRVICAHLGLRARERDVQVDRLGELLDSTAERETTILAGDFNEWRPFRPALRGLQTRFEPAAKPATFPSLLPFLALDRLWFSSRIPSHIRWRVWKKSPARIASDHLPLMATITPQAPAARDAAKASSPASASPPS